MSGEVERVRSAYARRRALDRYDLAAPDVLAIDAIRRRVWAGAIRRHGAVRSLLEVGCGVGFALAWTSTLGVERRVGADLIHQRLVDASAVSPGVLRVEAEGSRLPLPDATFDAVACSTLFSSVLDDSVAVAIAAEVDRVLRPGGLVLWFDMARANPANPDVRKVGRDDLGRWFPDYRQELERAVLAPPVARRLRRWPRLIDALEGLPPLRTHLAGALHRRP